MSVSAIFPYALWKYAKGFRRTSEPHERRWTDG